MYPFGKTICAGSDAGIVSNRFLRQYRCVCGWRSGVHVRLLYAILALSEKDI